MKKFIFLTIFHFSFFIFHSFCFSQNVNTNIGTNPLSQLKRSRTIDSILILLKTDKVDTNKLIHLNELSWEYKNIGSYDSAMLYANSALQLGNVMLGKVTNLKIKHATRKFIAASYNNLGLVYYNKGNYLEAIKNNIASMKIYETIDNKKGIAISYNNIGLVYDDQGNYPEALRNYIASLKIYESTGSKEGVSRAYNNIGLVYSAQGNYPEALKNYNASLKIKITICDKKGEAYLYNNIGNVYKELGNYSEALKNYFACLKIMETTGNKKGEATSFNNIGLVFTAQAEVIRKKGGSPDSVGSKLNKALKNHMISLKIRETIGNKAGIASSFNNIGNVFTKQKKNKNAKIYLIKAKELAKKIGYKEILKNTYNALTELDSSIGNFKGAYENHKLFIIYRDSLDNEETRKKTIQSQMTYDFEKKEAVAIVEHKKEMENQKALAEEKSRKQKLIIGFVIFGLLLVMIFAGLIFRSLHITRKQKNIIETQKDEITAQRDLVTEQKEHIEEIYEELSDSINYAKRIQQAILPDLDEILRHMIRQAQHDSHPEPVDGWNLEFEAFILFKPKDIVSGDFYWATKINEWLIVTVADCTGHGVPGAFMSMLGISFLNEIVRKKEITKASEVLDELRTSVIDALKQKGESGEQKDGMDIAFCAINMNTCEMQFAGANNPCWIVKSEKLKVESEALSLSKGEKDGNENNFINFTNFQLYELKGDKMPIGIHANMQPFTNQKYQLQKGDTIYLMSDGYEDQFGGPNRKKFLSKNLKQLLTANSLLPLTEQKQILESTITEWIGNGEQIDDITVLGIKL